MHPKRTYNDDKTKLHHTKTNKKTGTTTPQRPQHQKINEHILAARVRYTFNIQPWPSHGQWLVHVTDHKPRKLQSKTYIILQYHLQGWTYDTAKQQNESSVWCSCKGVLRRTGSHTEALSFYKTFSTQRRYRHVIWYIAFCPVAVFWRFISVILLCVCVCWGERHVILLRILCPNFFPRTNSGSDDTDFESQNRIERTIPRISDSRMRFLRINFLYYFVCSTVVLQ